MIQLCSMLLALSQAAFAQEVVEFSLKGEIGNARTSKVHSSTILSCHSVSGCAQYIPDQEPFPYHLEYKRDILIGTQGPAFVLPGLTMKSDQMNVFFFDSLGRIAKVNVTKESIVEGAVDVGKVNLAEPVMVSGNVLFSDAIEGLDPSQLSITVSEMGEKGRLSLVAFSQLTDDNTFHLGMPPGRYTIFFDVPDHSGNWRRATREIAVGLKPIDIKNVSLSTPLDQMVSDQATIQEVLKAFDTTELDERQVKVFNQVVVNPSGVTLVYFMAGYCGPCLGPKGLSHYIDLTQSFPNRLSVLGIHADSYGVAKNCPQSQTQLQSYLQTQKTWQNIQSSYVKAKQKEQGVVLAYQSPSFAKALLINGYPTTIIFKDGVIQTWFSGSNPKVEQTIRTLLE